MAHADPLSSSFKFALVDGVTVDLVQDFTAGSAGTNPFDMVALPSVTVDNNNNTDIDVVVRHRILFVKNFPGDELWLLEQDEYFIKKNGTNRTTRTATQFTLVAGGDAEMHKLAEDRLQGGFDLTVPTTTQVKSKYFLTAWSDRWGTQLYYYDATSDIHKKNITRIVTQDANDTTSSLPTGIVSPRNIYYLPFTNNEVVFWARYDNRQLTSDENDPPWVLYRTHANGPAERLYEFPYSPYRSLRVSRVGTIVGDRVVVEMSYIVEGTAERTYELWSTNGTPLGTIRLGADMNLTSAGPFQFRTDPNPPFTDVLYFGGSTDGRQTSGLWVTDGWNVRLVQANLTVQTVSPTLLSNDVTLLGTADYSQIWQTDGTAQGTKLVYEGDGPNAIFSIGVAMQDRIIAFLTNATGNNALLMYSFGVNDTSLTFERVIDPTGLARPVYVKAIPDGRYLIGLELNDKNETTGELMRGFRQLWVVDGTAEGTLPFAQFPPQPEDEDGTYFVLAVVNSRLCYVRAYTNETGFEIFRVSIPPDTRERTNTSSPMTHENTTTMPSTTAPTASPHAAASNVKTSPPTNIPVPDTTLPTVADQTTASPVSQTMLPSQSSQGSKPAVPGKMSQYLAVSLWIWNAILN